MDFIEPKALAEALLAQTPSPSPVFVVIKEALHPLEVLANRGGRLFFGHSTIAEFTSTKNMEQVKTFLSGVIENVAGSLTVGSTVEGHAIQRSAAHGHGSLIRSASVDEDPLYRANVHRLAESIYLVTILSSRPPADETDDDATSDSRSRPSSPTHGDASSHHPGFKLTEEEHSMVLQAARAVLTSGNFKDCAQTIFKHAKKASGATAGYVALLSSDGTENEVVFLDPGDLLCTVPEGAPMPIRGLRGMAYHSGHPVSDNAFRHSPHWKFMPEGHVHLKNVMFVPLVVDGKTVGLLGLANKNGDFSTRDQLVCGFLGQFVTISLVNSRNLQKLRASERRYRRFVQHLQGIAWQLQRADQAWGWRVAFIHGQVEAITGWTADHFWDVDASVLMNLVCPEDGAESDSPPPSFQLVNALRRSDTDRSTPPAAAADNDRDDLVSEAGDALNEFRIQHKDGSKKWIMESVTGDQNTIEGIWQDVTAIREAEEIQRKLESQLQHAQRLESLGILAGGIAHDFNNLLAGVIGNTQYVSQLMKGDTQPPNTETWYQKLKPALKDIEDAATSASKLSQLMLAYSGKAPMLIARANLAQIAKNVLPLLLGSIPKTASLEMHVQDGLPDVMADPAQVQQVIMNLVINASEALEGKLGRIILKTSETTLSLGDLHSGEFIVPLETIIKSPNTSRGTTPLRRRSESSDDDASLPSDNPLLASLSHTLTNSSTGSGPVVNSPRIGASALSGRLPHSSGASRGWSPGAGRCRASKRFVCLSITDTGCGMDWSTRERIFDPFFTTKFTGRGLGLAASLGIVKRHQGTIHLTSTPGQGSCFEVYFPLAPEGPLDVGSASEHEHDVPLEDPSPRARRCNAKPFNAQEHTVLLVDDEAVVRMVGARLLEQGGYTVIQARDGLDGVHEYRTHAGKVSCVILDLSMPRLDGKGAFKEIRKISATVPVIITSGYDRDCVMDEFGADVSSFIPKPFRAHQLLDEVKKAILR